MAYGISLSRISVLLAALMFGGCASLAFQQDVPRHAYVAGGEDEFDRYMPIVVSEHPDRSYNRIGRPEVTEDAEQVRLTINPDMAVAYAEKRRFETDRAAYTNFIYRIHFEKVPFSLLPFNLTEGRNVGLLIVITLNERQQPVLITTVHTCGCYMAMVPTNYLPEDAYPPHWDRQGQDVYGASLPGLLKFDATEKGEKFVIYLRDETHRVIHLDVASHDDVAARYDIQPLTVHPVAALDALELADSGARVSMFEPGGSRQDYVRDSHKPFEFLFMSWWSFDVRVGVDKRYGLPGGQGRVFYTSLKPWARRESDMRDFPAFLRYWGWHL